MWDWINPFKWVTPDQYQSFWEKVYYHIFHGFWARFLALLCLFVAVWVFVRRQNLPLSLLFLIMSFCIAYFGYFLSVFFGI